MINILTMKKSICIKLTIKEIYLIKNTIISGCKNINILPKKKILKIIRNINYQDLYKF